MQLRLSRCCDPFLRRDTHGAFGGPRAPHRHISQADERLGPLPHHIAQRYVQGRQVAVNIAKNGQPEALSQVQSHISAY